MASCDACVNPPDQLLLSYTLSASSITLGSAATLSWRTHKATRVYINNAAVAKNGSMVVRPTATINYRIDVDGPGPRISRVLTLVVSAPPPPTPPPPQTITSFVASASSITFGQSVTLTWVTANAGGVTLNGLAVASSGSSTQSPPITQSYTLVATGSAAAVSNSLNVAVTQAPPPPPPPPLAQTIDAFAASSLSIVAGQQVTLTWHTSNATLVKLNGAITTATAATVAPAVSTVYTLLVSGSVPDLSSSLTITVAALPPPPPPPPPVQTIDTFTAMPSSLNVGQQTVLTWATSNATSVTLNGATVALSGSLADSPAATKSYTLIAMGSAPNVTRVVTVAVSAPTLSIGNVSSSEGNTGTTPFVFVVTLSSISAAIVSVQYATSNGTATAGIDYTAQSGTLVFQPNVTTRTITILVNGDAVLESNETFFVSLSGPSNATIATGVGTGTIINDEPTPPGTGLLRFVQSYPMAKPLNEANGKIPFFGKHEAPAYNSAEKALYLFGGDGTSQIGQDPNSAGWHYGRVWLTSANPYNAPAPVFDHFYPYWGITGKAVPAGYDCVPFVYDAGRNCFWQTGGYQWPLSSPVVAGPWLGTEEQGGTWKFQAGEWIHVSTTDVPLSLSEGMQAIYYARTDHMVGTYLDWLWYYDCAHNTFGNLRLNFGLIDDRTIGNFSQNAYDPVKDEMLAYAPAQAAILGYDMAQFPTTVPVRVVKGGLPDFQGNTGGQTPLLFIPSRRTAIIMGLVDYIWQINVDTGAVTVLDYAPGTAPAVINEAIYSAELDSIWGVQKDSSLVWKLDWGGTTPPPPITAGQVTAVGVNKLSDINPSPSRNHVYDGGTGYSSITLAWGGSAYARDYSTLGAVLIWNGGDADYWGNQVSCFDFDTMTWTRLTEPTTAMTGSTSEGLPGYDPVLGLHDPSGPTVQPSCPHDYDSAQYIPPSVGHPLGQLAFAQRLYCYGPRSAHAGAFFDLSTKVWRAVFFPRWFVAMDNVNSIYDSLRKWIWFRGDGNFGFLNYFDTATDTYNFVGCNGGGTHYGTDGYDAANDRLVSLGQAQTFQYIDLANIAAGVIQVTLTGDALPANDNQAPGFDWCPTLSCGFGYYSIDPQAVYKFTFTSTTTASVQRIIMGGTTITPFNAHTFSKFRWADKLGAFYLIGGVGDPVWLYKP